MLELRYEEIAKLFTYDRVTGILYWKARTDNAVRCKYVAGSKTKDGYRQVGIKGKIYLEHRIIMLLCYGHIPDNAEVDHINHIRDDNRLVNLRFVTKLGNGRNQSISSRNTTDVTGVYFNKSQNKFMAQIRVNYQAIHLGYYDTLEEAAAARAEADLKFKFHANHGK